MPLLSQSVKAAYDARASKATGSGNYLNPGSISEGTKVRITFLGDDSIAGWEAWGTETAASVFRCASPKSPPAKNWNCGPTR